MTRPNSFKAEYEEQVYKLALLGLKDTEIAKYFDIAERTLNYWKKKYPAFLQSLKKGRANADGEVVKSLYNRAVGARIKVEQAIKVKEVFYNDNGKKYKEKEKVEIVELTQEVPPDTTACIYWLKNRQSDKWRDKIEHLGSDNTETTQEAFLKHLKELGNNAD